MWLNAGHGAQTVDFNKIARVFLNLAAYRFVDLDALNTLRAELLELGRSLDVRGTVLLAAEGVNMNICARRDAALRFADALRDALPDAHLTVRRSWSERNNFERFLVKIKREIITFGQPQVRPAQQRAPTVSPAQLARWLDQSHDDLGRPLALIDTRNRFEIGYGSFAGAIDPGIDSFTQLPARIDALRGELADRRVIAFCTGGIRCEKAVAWLNQNGFADAAQLDGGVLRYFDEIGAKHWRGNLFVFDQRECLTPLLRPVRESQAPSPQR